MAPALRRSHREIGIYVGKFSTAPSRPICRSSSQRHSSWSSILRPSRSSASLSRPRYSPVPPRSSSERAWSKRRGDCLVPHSTRYTHRMCGGFASPPASARSSWSSHTIEAARLLFCVVSDGRQHYRGANLCVLRSLSASLLSRL
jgi:hypothetical protein